ncbi:uncharacterized protein LOC117303332 [Asterias rubens]|uniref:uncharacterized protein LOC117303332 n=1 Tax=Asterias rubens TaxID=7604 RepID=UPI0014552FE5|nr:uncharacterized protein LOC117303332 [Asterias rubens]
MASAWLCFALCITAVIVTVAAATGEETIWLTSDLEDSTTLAYDTQSYSDPAPNSNFLNELNEKLLKQGDSVLKSMQAYLMKFQQLVSAGSNPQEPVPTTGEAGIRRTLTGGGATTTPDGDPSEKRSSTPPISKDDILREIIRRIREEAAGYPLELPLGMRFIEQPLGTTLQTYHSDSPEKRDADRDAVRDEILRRLLELQRSRLPGMRAGK